MVATEPSRNLSVTGEVIFLSQTYESMSEIRTGVILYAAREAVSPRTNKEYVDMMVKLDDGVEAKMFADGPEDKEHMMQFNVGDLVEVTDVRKSGQYTNCTVGALIESAADREARVGDLDQILAEEYALSFRAADVAMAQAVVNLPIEQAMSVIQAAASSVFIQKSRMADFIERAEKRAA